VSKVAKGKRGERKAAIPFQSPQKKEGLNGGLSHPVHTIGGKKGGSVNDEEWKRGGDVFPVTVKGEGTLFVERGERQLRIFPFH